MRCPRCFLRIHLRAPSCPHCGFEMEQAEAKYGEDTVNLHQLTDAAGVLRMKEREPLRDALERFEERFPQLFLAIYVGGFEKGVNLRELGFWMLNRSNFVDVEEARPNENGILLLVDVNSKQACLSFGYSLMPYLSEESTFGVLSKAHPLLLEGEYALGFHEVVDRMDDLLRRGWKRVRRRPEKILSAVAQRLVGEGKEEEE